MLAKRGAHRSCEFQAQQHLPAIARAIDSCFNLSCFVSSLSSTSIGTTFSVFSASLDILGAWYSSQSVNTFSPSLDDEL